jgi:hypothetical protein
VFGNRSFLNGGQDMGALSKVVCLYNLWVFNYSDAFAYGVAYLKNLLKILYKVMFLEKGIPKIISHMRHEFYECPTLICSSSVALFLKY